MAKYREDYVDPNTGETKTDWTLRLRLVGIYFNPRMPPDAVSPVDPYPGDFNKGAQPVTGTPLSDLPRYSEARVKGNPQLIEKLGDRTFMPASAFFNDWIKYIPIVSRQRVKFRTDSILVETPCWPASDGWSNLPSSVSGHIPTWDKWNYAAANLGKNKESTDVNFGAEIERSVNIAACLRDPRPFFDPFRQENVMGGYLNLLEAVNAKYIDWLLVLGQGHGGTFYGEASMYGPDDSVFVGLKGPWKCQEIWKDIVPMSYAQQIEHINTGTKDYLFIPMQHSGLRVFDITTSGSVTEVAHFPACNAKGIYVDYPSSTVYMTDAVSEEGGALYVLDITNFETGTIKMKQWLPLEHGNFQHGIYKYGTYLLEHDDMNLRTIDTSDLSYTDTPFVTTDSSHYGNYAHKERSLRLFTFGNYLVVPHTYTFEVYDISALPTLTFKTWLAYQYLWYYRSGVKNGNYLYAVTSDGLTASSDGHLAIYDFTTPTSPSIEASSATYSGEPFLGVTTDGTYIYVISSLNLRIFNSVLTEQGSVSLDSSNSQYAACYYHNYGSGNERLYVISKDGRIDVYNVTTKTAPTYIGVAYDCKDNTNALDVSKGYVLQRLFSSVFGELNAIVDPNNPPPVGGNFWESFQHWTEWNLGKFWYTHPDDGGHEASPAGYLTYGSWQYRTNPMGTAYPNGSGFTVWDRFRLTDKDISAMIFNGQLDSEEVRSSKFMAGLGRPHLPFNTPAFITYNQNSLFNIPSYHYDSDELVLSTVDMWETFPNFSGELRWVNMQTCIDFWGGELGGGHESWEKFWFYHLPYQEGTFTDGKHVNNWWEYIFNYQEYITGATDPDYGSYFPAGEIGTAPSTSSPKEFV